MASAPWIEFRIGNASLMIFGREGGPPGDPTQVPWVYVDDLAADLEDNQWTFAQARPTQRV